MLTFVYVLWVFKCFICEIKNFKEYLGLTRKMKFKDVAVNVEARILNFSEVLYKVSTEIELIWNFAAATGQRPLKYIGRQ